MSTTAPVGTKTPVGSGRRGSATQRSGAQRSGAQRSGAQDSGAQRSGQKSGATRSGIQKSAARKSEAQLTPKRSAAERAYARRRRRDDRIADPRLTRVGHPIRETMARIPFVIVVLALLAVGGVGVLYLNTRTDEAGMRTTESQDRSGDLRLRIEQLRRDVAGLDATPEIARRAEQMGLVPAGDPAIIRVPVKGPATVIGTPHPATAVAAAAPQVNGGAR